MFTRLYITLAALTLAGCTTMQSAMIAPSSSISHAEGHRMARAWVGANAARSYSSVADTGSMRPHLDGNCLLLLEAYTGGWLKEGQVVVADVRNTKSVVHRVVSIDRLNRAVILSGSANARSDGWVPVKDIHWRVAGVLYLVPDQL